ncbi:hypothetical protein H8F25_16455 [Synechococcus sp. CBW1004]|nr:hypothetical protein H8F25_16455 [Synechococcus sp. CBW1004]
MSLLLVAVVVILRRCHRLRDPYRFAYPSTSAWCPLELGQALLVMYLVVGIHVDNGLLGV